MTYQLNLTLVTRTNRPNVLLWLNFSHSHKGLALFFPVQQSHLESYCSRELKQYLVVLVTAVILDLGHTYCVSASLCAGTFPGGCRVRREHIWPVSLIKLAWVKMASALRSLRFKGLKGSVLFVHSWPCKSLHTPTWASNTPPQQKRPPLTAGIASVYSISYCNWLCWMLSRSFAGLSKILLRKRLQPPCIYCCSSILNWSVFWTIFKCCYSCCKSIQICWKC